MRTTLTLADDVYQAARTLAESSGRSLGEVISTLARRGLRPATEVVAEGRLPTFRVPPGAELIPGSRAAELAAREGVE